MKPVGKRDVMLISTKGRYALRVMADLAAHDEAGYVPLKEIAVRQGISEKYMESIIVSLSRAGLVIGLRGKGGGYRLAKKPEECCVATILELTDGSLAPVSCMEHQPCDCARVGDCKTRPLWEGLGRRINAYLEGITLADVVNGTIPE